MVRHEQQHFLLINPLINCIFSTESGTGFVFGIAQIVVNPPFAAELYLFQSFLYVQIQVHVNVHEHRRILEKQNVLFHQ